MDGAADDTIRNVYRENKKKKKKKKSRLKIKNKIEGNNGDAM